MNQQGSEFDVDKKGYKMNSITTDASKQLARPRHAAPLRFDEFCSTLSVCFCLITVMISYYHIFHHLRNKSRGMEGRLVTRILFAAPIYSLYSAILSYNDSYDNFTYMIRDWYGAYVIYGFVSLCYVYIGGEETVIERNTVKTLRFYERAAQQYCFVKPFLSFVAAYLQLSKNYKDGDWSFHSGYIYITILTTFSVTLATYGLFSFLNTARGMMKTYNLVLKFIIVTFIVFGTYWQGVILALVEEAIASGSTDPGTVAARYQNWLVCFDMLPTAIAMRIAFPFQAIANNDANNEEHTVEYSVKQTPPDPELVIVLKSSSDSLYPLL